MYSPQDAPEVLCRRIEDCQEVQILGEDPCTAQQLLNNAVRLLLQTGLYTRDFEDWDRKIASDKIWTNLKMFIQEAYTRRLNATSITTGAHGYVQNAYAALAAESEDEDDDVHTVITQMAALTTQSQLTASTAAETNASVTAAMNQLAANQQVMQQQFAAFTATCNTTYQPTLPAAPPPMQQLTIPRLGTFQPAGFGFGGRRGGNVDAESVQTRDATGVHHLQILWVVVTKVAYPPLEGEGMGRSHNKMRHVMRRRCIPILLKDMQTGTFVSHVGLMLRMDIHPKHAQPPGDAQISRGIHSRKLWAVYCGRI